MVGEHPKRSPRRQMAALVEFLSSRDVADVSPVDIRRRIRVAALQGISPAAATFRQIEDGELRPRQRLEPAPVNGGQRGAVVQHMGHVVAVGPRARSRARRARSRSCVPRGW